MGKVARNCEIMRIEWEKPWENCEIMRTEWENPWEIWKKIFINNIILMLALYICKNYEKIAQQYNSLNINKT